ncbi:hypothetical protein HanXRQr2_Chr15g0712591 [Helianthus annuus]|uniref:Uncharacterized protein n=1 Tax=Helianthus annuus TaxID=4232 RepID=A0A9K3E528_HELAN|nr:hypothetical protein HanXRQr2_Chr15g0712591 [Helianthus annuus]KAJ0452636.1 hypothetical protein HanHA300_Chr15g0581161 [Helianthus annuus]KAJ0474544.1 hypothetical protein HanHA89_Chr15g0630891 [Helianthus annuus]KAJ0650101.1 hypothetical protein HanLR1_Chr15g0591811 [Helianthus annuus]KAJ0653873.1 hypothetical protein HanOQP8_Chr15g0588471 [Helianthus annuus]
MTAVVRTGEDNFISRKTPPEITSWSSPAVVGTTAVPPELLLRPPLLPPEKPTSG